MSAAPLTSVVILGGGTAGWMTAASLAVRFHGLPLDITLIEASDIATIGVGEATVPAIRDYFASLGLDTRDVMRATRGTVKLGIEFAGWKTAHDTFFHPFGLYGAKAGTIPFHQLWLALGQDRALADYNLCTRMAYAGRFAPPHSPARGDFDVYDWAIHFDAGLFARYLRDFATARGVRRIDAKLADVDIRAEDGHVTALKLDTGETITGDLFIDCSGLRSLLLQGALQTPFIDWKHWLPCDRAIAMPSTFERSSAAQARRARGDAQSRLPEADASGASETITPYTRATAQAAGWTWRIPLQHRVGNGYVYDSEAISDGDAEATLRSALEGEGLNDANRIHFRTGHAQSFWSKNVVGIGLSSGFLEPLESTSIALIQSGIDKLLALFPDQGFAPHLRREYNRTTTLEFERIRDFILLHYHASQRPEPFWQARRESPVPDSLAQRIDLFRSHGHFVRQDWDSFFDASWLSLYAGFGWLPPARPEAVAGADFDYLKRILPRLRGDIRGLAAAAPPHAAFLEGLRDA